MNEPIVRINGVIDRRGQYQTSPPPSLSLEHLECTPIYTTRTKRTPVFRVEQTTLEGSE